jgi:energy-coupling factor transporter ATP-binding protein EcfA2
VRLKPVKFVGHKIGPFDHIELNWQQDSDYTLIVAENGLGKTTLVAAMAACLSLGDDTLFPDEHFERFAHYKTGDSFAYLEIDMEGEAGWIIHWGSGTFAYSGINPSDPYAGFPYLVYKLKDRRIHAPKSDLKQGTLQLPGSLTLELKEAIYIDNGLGASVTMPVVCSQNLLPLMETQQDVQNTKVLIAAYGVSRDIQHAEIREHQDLDDQVLRDILNPFAPIQSREIFQWIFNQHTNRVYALAEGKEEEAQAYLAAVRRVENSLAELEQPISFQVKRNPLRLEVRRNGTILTLDQLSDGTRSLLSWPLDYLMRASRVSWANPADSATAPGLILVDEIDAHLHPEWQRRVMSVVSQLLPETYIIATTHSPFVVGSTDNAQVFRVYREDDGKLSVQSSFDELYGYPADLVLEKTFVKSLYAPELEKDLIRLSELAREVAAGTISPPQREEYDRLMQKLARVSPWLNNLLSVTQAKETSS